MLCKVTLWADSVRSHSLINAPSTIDAALIALRDVPDDAGVKMIVRAIAPRAANDSF